MAENRRVIGCVVFVALLVTACSGGGGKVAGAPTAPTRATGPLVVGGKVDLQALGATRATFAALGHAQQQERANTASGDLERQLYKVSGLEKALGGPTAANTSIMEAAKWSAGLAGKASEGASTVQLRPQGKRGVVLPQDGTPSLGEGIFGGLLVTMLGADGAVSATNDGTTGKGTLAEGVHIEATGARVELTTKNSFTDSTGVTTELATRTAVAPCPAADGTFEASAKIDVSSTIDHGATGKRGTFDVTVKGTVNDDAGLVGYDSSYRGQMADFVAKRGGYVDFAATTPRSGTGTFTVNRTGGTVTESLVKDTVLMATLVSALVGDRLVASAQKGWESGRCVVLKPTVSAGPKGLKPSASVTITAAPRSKLDGRPVGGKVTAVLSAGEASVSPSGTKVPADAIFTYIAPGAKDKSGSVALESRSRRGVAKATVDFDTKQAAYRATGADEVTFSGTVASVTAVFSIKGTFPGGSATFTFDGAGEHGGTVKISGGGSGAKVTGSGTYTVVDNDDGTKTLNVKAHSCVDVSGQCRDGTHVITLTPLR